MARVVPQKLEKWGLMDTLSAEKDLHPARRQKRMLEMINSRDFTHVSDLSA